MVRDKWHFAVGSQVLVLHKAELENESKISELPEIQENDTIHLRLLSHRAYSAKDLLCATDLSKPTRRDPTGMEFRTRSAGAASPALSQNASIDIGEETSFLAISSTDDENLAACGPPPASPVPPTKTSKTLKKTMPNYAREKGNIVRSMGKKRPSSSASSVASAERQKEREKVVSSVRRENIKSLNRWLSDLRVKQVETENMSTSADAAKNMIHTIDVHESQESLNTSTGGRRCTCCGRSRSRHGRHSRGLGAQTWGSFDGDSSGFDSDSDIFFDKDGKGLPPWHGRPESADSEIFDLHLAKKGIELCEDVADLESVLSGIMKKYKQGAVTAEEFAICMGAFQKKMQKLRLLKEQDPLEELQALKARFTVSEEDRFDLNHKLETKEKKELDLATEILMLRDYIAQFESMVPRRYKTKMKQLEEEKHGASNGKNYNFLFQSNVDWINKDSRLVFSQVDHNDDGYELRRQNLQRELDDYEENEEERERILRSPREGLGKMLNKVQAVSRAIERFEEASQDTEGMMVRMGNFAAEYANQQSGNSNKDQSASQVRVVDTDDIGIQVDLSKAEQDEKWQKSKKKTINKSCMWDLIGGKVKGSTMPYKTLLKLAWELMIGKVTSDQIDDREGLPRQTLCQFVFDSQLFKYGLKSLTIKKVQDLATSLLLYRDKHPRLALLVHHLGISPDGVIPDKASVDFVYNALACFVAIDVNCFFGPESEGQVTMIRSVTIDAIMQVFPTISGRNFQIIRQRLEDLPTCKPPVGAKDIYGTLVDIDMVISIYKDTRIIMQSAIAETFKAAFLAADVNADGVMDLGEFRTLVGLVDSTKSERQIKLMFSDAQTGFGMEGDALSPDIFAKLGAKHGIYPKDISLPLTDNEDIFTYTRSYMEMFFKDNNKALLEISSNNPEVNDQLEERFGQIERFLANPETTETVISFALNLLEVEWREATS